MSVAAAAVLVAEVAEVEPDAFVGKRMSRKQALERTNKLGCPVVALARRSRLGLHTARAVWGTPAVENTLGRQVVAVHNRCQERRTVHTSEREHLGEEVLGNIPQGRSVAGCLDFAQGRPEEGKYSLPGPAVAEVVPAIADEAPGGIGGAYAAQAVAPEGTACPAQDCVYYRNRRCLCSSSP